MDAFGKPPQQRDNTKGHVQIILQYFQHNSYWFKDTGGYQPAS